MSRAEIDIPENPDAVRALIAEMQARVAASDLALVTERKAHDATRNRADAAQNAVRLTTLQIEKLKVQLARLRRMKFGQSSERLTPLADQLELTLEDMEAAHSHAACTIVGAVAPEPSTGTGRKPKREPLPAHLPRDEVVHPAPQTDGCTACGGAMSALGEDVTEVLEYVPGRFGVARHVRPKLACDRAAAMYSLLETCRLNGVNPQTWLAGVLERIGRGHTVSRFNSFRTAPYRHRRQNRARRSPWVSTDLRRSEWITCR